MRKTNVKAKIERNEGGYLELPIISEVVEVLETNEETRNVEDESKPINKKVIDSEIIGKIPLKIISAIQLEEYRNSDIPGFVLKDRDTYYYTEIRNFEVDVDDIIGEHKCSFGRYCCKHLSAASDADGGCAKVRGLSNTIEKYDFITLGYETFNTTHDVFVVLKCSHYVISEEKC